jgi:hypothetical protein
LDGSFDLEQSKGGRGLRHETTIVSLQSQEGLVIRAT